MSLDLTELRELLTSLDKTDIAELILKSDDFELTVRRGLRSEGGQPHLTQVTSGEIIGVNSQPTLAISGIVAGGDASRGGEAAGTSGHSSVPSSSDRRLVDITSLMVGTFYRSPAPDEPPFVEVGDRVRSGQTVCIIEAMKLMNELESEVSGEIVEILIQNGQPVEYGQPLMRVSPVS